MSAKKKSVMKSNISVEASVAGFKLGVQEATISLGVNAIPSVTLTCAPNELGKKASGKATVMDPSLSYHIASYRNLSALAQGLSEEGKVSIDVSGDDSGSCTLSGWVLSGVGMSGITSTSAPYLSVVLQHPICRLTKAGSIYETPKGDMWKNLRSAVSGKTNFIEIVDEAYRYMSGAGAMFWPPQKGGEIASKFREALSKQKLADYLSWKGENGIFLSAGTKAGPRIAQAIGTAAFIGNGGSSTWDMILRSTGTLLLSVTQDESNNYTKKKLVLEPTQPWKEASLTIGEERCLSVDVPGMDPLRLAGVMARKYGPCAEMVNDGLLPNGSTLEARPTEEVMYSPVKDVDTAGGRIMKIGPPAILDAAFRNDAPEGDTVQTADVNMVDLLKNGYDKVIEKYCKAVYETTVASMMQATVRMAVTFRSDGKLLVPGCTCRMKSGKSDLFYGYVTNVVHHVSTSGENSTVVKMSYVRPEASFKIKGQEAIKAGAPNAAYE